MNQTHFHKRNLPHIYRPNSTYFITYRLKGTIPLKILERLKEKYITGKTRKTKTEKYKNEKLFFAEYDKYLDNNIKIQYLKNKEVAKIVKESLYHYDKKEYNLICYTVMPNHVHLVFHLLEEENKKVKTYSQTGMTTVRKANLQTDSLQNKNVSQTFQSVKINVPQTGKSTIRKPKIIKTMNVDDIMKSIKGYSAREANKILGRKGSFWQTESFDHIVRNEDELNRIVKYVIMNPVKAGLAEKWQNWEHTYLADEWW